MLKKSNFDPFRNILAFSIWQINLRIRSIIPVSISCKSGGLRFVIFSPYFMWIIGILRDIDLIGAISERANSTMAQKRVVPLVLIEVAVILFFHILEMHRLRETSVLANQLYSILPRVSLINWRFGLRNRSEPFVMLVVAIHSRTSLGLLIVLSSKIALVKDSESRLCS